MNPTHTVASERWEFLTAASLHQLWNPFMVDIFLGESSRLDPAALLASEIFYRQVTRSGERRDALYETAQWTPETVQTGLNRGKPLLWKFLSVHRAALLRRLKCTFATEDTLEEVASIMQAFILEYAHEFQVGETGPGGVFRPNLFEAFCHSHPLKKCLGAIAATLFSHSHVALDSDGGALLGEALCDDLLISDPRLDEVGLLSLQAMRDVEPIDPEDKEDFWAMICLRMLGVTLERMGVLFGTSKRMLWYRMTNIENKITARMKYLLTVETAQSGTNWRLAGCAQGSASPVARLAGRWETCPESGNPLTPLWDEFTQTLDARCRKH